MKKGFLTLSAIVAAFVAAPSAQAWVGGPFDSGDYNILHERGGVYQAVFSFRNGSGFSQFTQDNALGAQFASGAANLSTFSLENRSLMYYKGITYAGTAMGIVDFEKRFVHGYTNGTTTLQMSVSSATGGSSTAISDSVVVNGTDPDPGFGFSNSNFRAKITSSYPLLRFAGSGEVSFFIDPQLDVLRDILDSIELGDNVDISNPGNIATFINGLIPVLQAVDAAGNPSSYVELIPMRVLGSRRYF